MLTKISREKMTEICALLPLAPGQRERALAGDALDLGIAGEFAIADTEDNAAPIAAVGEPDLGDQVATLVEQMIGSRASSPPVALANLSLPDRDTGDRVATLIEQMNGAQLRL